MFLSMIQPLYLRRFELCLFVMAACLTCTVAHAANFEAESEALILTFARWFQRITTILAVIAIVEGGSRFWSDEKSQGARAHMKNVLVGCAISFGAIGITEMLKTSFSGRL